MLEYNVAFRVFRGDTGWYYAIRFLNESEVANIRPYASEANATKAGLEKLASMIAEKRARQKRGIHTGGSR